jgi:hypothetical protein
VWQWLRVSLNCRHEFPQTVIFNTGEFVSHNFWKSDQGAKICLKKGSDTVGELISMPKAKARHDILYSSAE